MEFEQFEDGYAFLADSTTQELYGRILAITGPLPLILCDPPYGRIVGEDWDQTEASASEFCDWMLDWTRMWARSLQRNAAFYVWGGIGIPQFRPFLRYLVEAETPEFQLANLITWAKKRAYGVQHNYLFVREELAYFINGPDIKKPRTFHVPYLDKERGYEGYNKKYPAKSKYLRRTNIWSDITEILRGKIHETQKPVPVMMIPIMVHTEPGEWVVDIFAGAGTTAVAARQLGRKFVVVEKKPEEYRKLVARLRGVGRASDDPAREVSTEQELFELVANYQE